MSSLATGLGLVYLFLLLIYLIVIVLFGLVVSLIFRPYVLWYFKINKRIELQEEANTLLEEIAQQKYVDNVVKTERSHAAYMPK